MTQRHRILIVDDDARDRQAVIRALRHDAAQIDGVEADVLEADTVAQARQALQAEEFACVFLDHDLPDGTSLDLLTDVRAQGLATPIVVLTGERDDQAVLEVMSAGALDYLPKEKLHPDLVARSLRAALRFQQAQREKKAVLDELRARDRAIASASNGISIADARKPDCPLVYTNEAFLRMTGYSEAEVIGANCRFLQGRDTDPDAVAELREAVRRERSTQVLLLNYRRDGTPFWNEVTVSPVRDPQGTLTHFVGIQTDVTVRHEADGERDRAQEAIHASEQALRASEGRLRDTQARLEAALSAGGIATWTYDLTADRVVADANLARLFSVSPEDAGGGRLEAYLRAVHPDDLPHVTEAIADAVAHRADYEAEYRVVLPDGSHRWLATRGRVERDPQGHAIALPGVVLDVTEQTERVRRERLLADLAERTRTLTDADEVIAEAVRSVGEFLGVARCVFVDIDTVTDACTCRPDYRADGSVLSMEGTFPISAFGEIVVAAYASGRAVAVEDVRLDRDQVPAENVVAYDALGIRAHVGVPVVHSTRLVSCIGIHSAVPRRWKPEEIELLQAVVGRTWLTVEVLRQQQALAREAEALREAHERTATILESITDASYALDAQWRITHVNRQAEALWGKPRGELLGLPFLSVFPQVGGSSFLAQHQRVMAERVAAHFETLWPVLGRWVEVSVYPTSDGGLSVFFHDISARKNLEAERERLAERERNIASQLQAALQPDLPGAVPGLAVTKYYEAALTDQAGVGGDFYDVFSIEKGRTALIVGDLSGKGLAAAAQVSVVRNTLRAFLYTRPTVADAVNDLNRVLAENNLLTGFTTLFVGAYDGGTRKLRYVNCGQEPALVRRGATGAVEALESTGPILGTLENARYAEEAVTLGPGDALAIFSDGLTEVGPTRTAMLGVEGVTALFGQPVADADIGDAVEMAEYLTLRLIGGVDAAAAGGVMRDDVCLLVAVVEGGT